MSSLNTVAPQKKYGLIKKNAPAAATKRKILSRAACFDELDDDDPNEDDASDETVNSSKRMKNLDIDRVNKSLIQQSQTSSMNIEDSDIYDYDGYLEKKKEIDQSNREKELVKKRELSVSAPKASYIHNLKSAALVREKEKDRIFEKKLLKERLADEEGMDKDAADTKFVTSAYKKKLMEQKKWETEDRLMDAVEKNTTINGSGESGGGLMGFYSNLLTKNISMGSADVADVGLSAYTSGSKRQLDIMSTNHSDAKSEETSKNAVVTSEPRTGAESPSASTSPLPETAEKNDRKDDSRDCSDNNCSHKPASTSETVEDAAQQRAIRVQSAKERYLARKAMKSS